MEHTGNHASFLNLDINIVDGKFIYKLYDKRDTFPFFIVRMPQRESNMPQNIFYSALMGEILRIARSTLLFEDFLPKASALISRMKNQGAGKSRTVQSIKKIIEKHKNEFIKFGYNTNALIKGILQY